MREGLMPLSSLSLYIHPLRTHDQSKICGCAEFLNTDKDVIYVYSPSSASLTKQCDSPSTVLTHSIVISADKRVFGLIESTPLLLPSAQSLYVPGICLCRVQNRPLYYARLLCHF